ncbi:glycoside hydrolase family 2 TIM barrel-domain containing protein [Chitinophaga sp. Cy-1792]|uniref:glycoside hydrolase family 2 TIM barrel-domain containing protein n=1 Tax=Chitinophaga sp. Cy-1792 TaxID=2608339 RepID=UPI00141E933E|nr:glycoside hydrolase family 2 TIM barrel-domain containing protein [Chitinophaga sp. Cy-1792]NIG55927.1 glycoside hydrolase family 2 [Chitinophaga sp. Cy-1792]
MKRKLNRWVSLIALSLLTGTGFGQQRVLTASFDTDAATPWVTGRGRAVVTNGVLQTENAYASFGDSSLTDYRFSFRACVPDKGRDVQIWAGFRAATRNDRYILALRGGNQDNLYLSRLGYMGTDEFLALRPLEFHPVAGTWYTITVEVVQQRIRVFLNDEKLPRIDVKDENSRLAPAGPVTLGGGWVPVSYDDLEITPLGPTALNNIPVYEFLPVPVPQAAKAEKRRQERAAWKPVSITDISAPRTEISLNGQWLFMPQYELSDERQAISPKNSDDNWHVMKVPDFWNPIRIWLHGEMFGKHSKGASDAYFQRETDRCESYTFDYKKTNAAWYRQWITLPKGIEQKDVALHFDAVSKVAEVYINGHLAGKHTGMFGDFTVDGKGLFKAGKNLVTVKVTRDYIKDIADAGKIVDVAVSVEVTNKMLKDLAHGFYNEDPAGIWQPVKMVITSPLSLKDVFIQPRLDGATFDVTVTNHTKSPQIFTISSRIGDLYKGSPLKDVQLKAGETKLLHYDIGQLKPLLWSPQTPNLYDFTFLLSQNGGVADSLVITSGFRTFESKNGFFYLNGRQYWLRGGNHTPFALAPNDVALAARFYDIMKAGNMEVTRTHTSPYNETWITAADRKGIGISFEGGWPWLMINNSMPDNKLIEMWADEYIDLLKKYRNHPSVLFWTVNNEMKFYGNDTDSARTRLKMKIISDVVKRMRKTDGTRPISFDSNYRRNTKKFGIDFFKDIDDGDIDDIHAYINWYDYTIFKQFNGEFQGKNKNPGRPLISQEMSSGYSNNETGHPVRFYTQVHQTPQELVGDLAYEFSDPAYFMEAQAFITGEQAEAYRRTNPEAAGILHFALLSWFKNVYDAETIAPYPAYFALQRALQPVLVSAELWGRHFYAGAKLPARICVVNDRHEGTLLQHPLLTWKLVDSLGGTLATGTQELPDVPYYGRVWVTPDITIPVQLPQSQVYGKLLLALSENNKTISANEYKVLLADLQPLTTGTAKVCLYDGSGKLHASLERINVKYTPATTVAAALATKAGVYVFSGLKLGGNINTAEVARLKGLLQAGARVIVTDAAAAKDLFPEYISGTVNVPEGDIVTMDIPESAVFAHISLMDLRYFNNNKRELPAVCNGALSVVRNPQVEVLAKHIRVHGYIQGEMQERAQQMAKNQGATIARVRNSGTLYLTTMSLEKADTDPVAGMLLYNLISGNDR